MKTVDFVVFFADGRSKVAMMCLCLILFISRTNFGNHFLFLLCQPPSAIDFFGEALLKYDIIDAFVWLFINVS